MPTPSYSFRTLGEANVQVSAAGGSAAAEGADGTAHGGIMRRTAVFSFSVNGQAVMLAVRLQRASNGLFVDAVAAESLAALNTALGSMDLSDVSHPSPSRDACDDEALTAAGLA